MTRIVVHLWQIFGPNYRPALKRTKFVQSLRLKNGTHDSA